MWAWRCYRSMSSSTPRETTGALPEWSGIQKTDKNMIIDPILQQYRAVMRAALQEHIRHHARAEEALQYSSLIASEELTELLKPVVLCPSNIFRCDTRPAKPLDLCLVDLY